MSELPRFVFPGGLSRKQAGRLIEISDALQDGGIEVEAFVDARLYDLNSPHCSDCGCLLGAGHCYCCKPVSGYGERFRASHHPAGSGEE